MPRSPIAALDDRRLQAGALLVAAALLAALLPLTAAPAQGAAATRTHDFEDGNWRAMDFTPNLPSPNPYNASLTLDCNRAYTGRCSARAYTGVGPGIQYARAMWGSWQGSGRPVSFRPNDDVWYSMAVFLPTGFYSSMESYVSIMRWDDYGTNNVSRGGLAAYSDGRWLLFRERDGRENQTNVLGSTRFQLAENRWHWVEVHQKLSASDGSALNEVFVNGTRIGSSTTRNSYGTVIDNLRFGIVATDQSRQRKPLTLWFDRVHAGTTRLTMAGSPAPAPTPTPTPTAAPVPPPPTAAPVPPATTRRPSSALDQRLLRRPSASVRVLEPRALR